MPFAPLELLSPAKNADIGMAAIDCGADAVYIGGPDFGARAAARNTFDDIARLAAYAKRFHVKTYMTLNTLIYEDELQAAKDVAWEAYRSGVDALIVQDMALVKLDLPPIALHASTQCDVRTPEKAAFLDACGMSQIVLARELTIEEVAKVRRAVPRAKLEYFVHGALCVSYSGQCYLSLATTGKSANRGQCTQPCRRAYRVFDFAGREIARRTHALCLKDNDQSEHLEALIEAGVSSFKIEGRLKDADYVKNITAYYREKIDAYLKTHPEATRGSLGESSPGFTPDPAKTFRRSATDYFAKGRHPFMAQLVSSKSTGEAVGEVLRVTGDKSFLAKCGVTLNNGDGLVITSGAEATDGLRVNRAILTADDTYEIRLFERLTSHTGIKPGAKLGRNVDAAFEKTLANAKSVRTMAASIAFRPREAGFELKAMSSGFEASIFVKEPFEVATNQAGVRDAMTRALAKSGESVFRIENVLLSDCESLPYVALREINAARREVLRALCQKIIDSHPKPVCLAPTQTRFESPYRDFRLNVANSVSYAFWVSQGIIPIQKAFEVDSEGVDLTTAELMRCRYCIRNELNLCPKSVKGDPAAKAAFKRQNAGHLKPEPLTLIDEAGRRLIATFDCKACEMSVMLSKNNKN